MMPLTGEHGEYAWNEKEQHLYPRKYFMEQVCGVMATSQRGRTCVLMCPKNAPW